MSARFTLVDGLRGVAALSVVLYHGVGGHHIDALLAIMPTPLQLVLSRGNCGVAIFFVLSGFVIAHSLPRDLTVSDVGRFMLRRSIRLDPPYWTAILLTCAIAISRGASFSTEQVGAHLLYLQDLLGFREISPIFWTLCLEIQFYLVFAFLLLTRSRAALASAFALSIPLSLGVVLPGLFTSLWYGFLLGAAAYSGSRWFLAYGTVLCAIGIYQQDVFMEVSVATALALFIAARAERLTTLLNWRWLQFLGTISYSLYLIHNPVTGAIFRIGFQVSGYSVPSEAVWWLASMAASIAIATMFYFVIERASIRLSKIVLVLPAPSKPASRKADIPLVPDNLIGLDHIG